MSPLKVVCFLLELVCPLLLLSSALYSSFLKSLMPSIIHTCIHMDIINSTGDLSGCLFPSPTLAQTRLQGTDVSVGNVESRHKQPLWWNLNINSIPDWLGEVMKP